MKDLQPISLEGINPNKPLIIAGPCSAETEEQVMTTARELASNGIKIFRAGIAQFSNNYSSDYCNFLYS